MDLSISAHISPTVHQGADVSPRQNVQLDRAQATSQTPTRAPEEARGGSRDSVELSPSVQLAFKTVRETADVRDDLVEHVRQGLRAGRTELDGRKLAEKLVSF